MFIYQIERIQNPTLYMQYYGKKKEMETANIGSHNPIERRLWLGTRSADVTQNIYQKGFDRKLKSGKIPYRYISLENGCVF